MNKILSAFAVSAMLFSAGGVSAQAFPGSGPWSMDTQPSTGDLNLYQTVPNVACVTSFAVSPSGSNYSVTGGSFGAGHAACGVNIIPLNFPWALSVSGTTVTITGVKVDAVYGICEGNLVGDYDTSSAQTVEFAPGTFIPGYLKASPSTSIPCYVDGILHVS